MNSASFTHEASARAIARGLTARAHGGYWLQISGASLFSLPDIESETYGSYRPTAFNDIADNPDLFSPITSSPPSRIVDQLTLSQDPAKIKTALPVGPLIYGVAEGPCSTRSMQLPDMARHTLQLGEGFKVGAGESVWSNVHVRDVGSAFVKLVEAAVEGRQGCWGEEGVYLLESGRMAFGELSNCVAVAAHAQGFIKSPEVTRTLTAAEADEVTERGSVLWATNAIISSSRAQEKLGWRPRGRSLRDEVPDAVKLEAESLGLV